MTSNIAENLLGFFRLLPDLSDLSSPPDKEKFQSLLFSCSDEAMIQNLRDEAFFGYSLLHWAAFRGWLDVFKYLVQNYNCDPYCETRNNCYTVLHTACYADQIGVVQYLITEFCMDPFKKDHSGMNALHWSRNGTASQYLQGVIDEASRQGFKKNQVVNYLKQCRKNKHEAAVVKAMKEGEGDLLQSNIILHGPPGAGKTSTKQLILGLPPFPREKQSATEILTNPVRAVSFIQMNQFRVIENDDLITMMAEEVCKYPTMKEKDQTNQMTPENKGESPQSLPNKKVSTPESPPSLTSIREALNKPRGSIKLFDSHWHHILDSGGQPQFQDILPLIYYSPSLNIVVVRLTDELDTKPSVCFYEDGKNVYSLPDHLALTNREIITNMCQIASCQGASQGVVPYVMIVGTHKDLLGVNSGVKISEWNKGLDSIKKEFGNVLICKSEEETIFAVNTMAEGAEREEYTKELQECISANTEQHASPVKVPLRWLAYQLDLDKDEGIVRISDCYKSGEALGMAEGDVQSALRFFSRIALVLYFPEDLPNLVLTKMDPIIGRLSRLVKATFLAPKWSTPADSEKLRTKGLFHKKFLLKVFKDIENTVINDDEFLRILECLKIAVKVSEDEYFLPSALSLDADSEKCLIEMHSVPLVFSWGERILPHGFFFTIVVELLGKPTEEDCIRFELRNDIAQCRKEIQVNAVHCEIPGVVKLINRTRWIQVCSSSSARHCHTIYKAVNAAVEKTMKRFEHTGIGSPIVTVLCPLCETKDHYCLLSSDMREFTCSMNKSRTGSVTSDMLCWVQETELSSAISSTSHIPQLRDVYCLLLPKSYDWDRIGAHLGVEFGFREGLLRNGAQRTNDSKLEAVLNNWIKSHCSDVTWENLIQVLTDLKFTDIARDVTSFIHKNKSSL